jgi:hypothetical protein
MTTILYALIPVVANVCPGASINSVGSAPSGNPGAYELLPYTEVILDVLLLPLAKDKFLPKETKPLTEILTPAQLMDIVPGLVAFI